MLQLLVHIRHPLRNVLSTHQIASSSSKHAKSLDSEDMQERRKTLLNERSSYLARTKSAILPGWKGEYDSNIEGLRLQGTLGFFSHERYITRNIHDSPRR